MGPAGDPGVEALEAVALHAAWLLRRQRELTASGAGRLTLIGEVLHRTPLWAHLKATLADGPTVLVEAREPVATGAALLALVRADAAPPDACLPRVGVAPLPAQARYANRLAEFVAAALGCQNWL